MTGATLVHDIQPISRLEAHTLAVRENERMLTLLRSLSDDDWSKPTDCTAWDVRALAAHVVGGTEMFCSMGNLARMMRAAKREAAGGSLVDAMSAIEVRTRTDMTTAQLIDALAVAGPKAAQFRYKMPAPFRVLSLKGELPGGGVEKWKIRYLLDVILTRDTWMHRVDITRATGREMVLTAEHDGRLVADVVAEWARRHGRPFRLELTSPAGGTYVSQETAESVFADAVEMCRILSGRAPGAGLLAYPVPF